MGQLNFHYKLLDIQELCCQSLEHFFDLPVTYKGNELILHSRLVTFGHHYKFFVTVDKFELQVERDDEMNFRVLNYDNDGQFDRVLLDGIVG